MTRQLLLRIALILLVAVAWTGLLIWAHDLKALEVGEVAPLVGVFITFLCLPWPNGPERVRSPQVRPAPAPTPRQLTEWDLQGFSAEERAIAYRIYPPIAPEPPKRTSWQILTEDD